MPGLDWSALSPSAIPLILFGLRCADLTLATLRMLALIRGRAWLAWACGFLEAGIFVIGAAGLLSNLDNPWNIAGYAAGFAFGNVIGITLERFVLPSHDLLRVYSSGRGSLIAEVLRKLGRGVTEVPARGLSGTVDVLYAMVKKAQVPKLRKQIVSIDPDAVVTIESVRSLVGGWRA